jgi:hypothetical protein
MSMKWFIGKNVDQAIKTLDYTKIRNWINILYCIKNSDYVKTLNWRNIKSRMANIGMDLQLITYVFDRINKFKNVKI